MNLRTRLTLTTLAAATIGVVLVALVGTLLAGVFLRQSAYDELGRQAAAATAAVAATRSTTDRPAVAEDRLALLFERTLARTGVDAALVDPTRPTGIAARLLSTAELARLEAGEQVRGTGTVGARQVAYVAEPGSPGVIVVRPIAVVREAVGGVARRLLAVGLLAIVVAGAIGYWLGGRIAAPVRRLEATVARVGRGELDRSPPEDVLRRPDELGDLGRGVGSMTAALREARDEQRGFFRSVAHELRTPLTNIRGYTEGLLDGHFEAGERHDQALEVVHDEAVRLQRFVDDVMTLARLDAGDFTLDASTGDVGAVVRSAVAAAEPVARAAGVSLREDAASVVVQTDPDRVRQVVDNLVANALRVTPAGGEIVVRVRGQGTGARIEVADTGPGIAVEDVPHAFERYALWRRYRSEREVGTGLGLAIVAGLVSRLGGAVSVDGGGEGRGATFRVDLPADLPRTAPV